MRCVFSPAAALVLLATVALAGELRTTVALSGFSCVTCSVAVTKALNQVPGVQKAEVSADRQSAVVIAEDRVAPKARAEAVRRLGYGVEVVQP